MKILVLNRGSSSIKCATFHFKDPKKLSKDPVWKGSFEWKNINQNSLAKKIEELVKDQEIDWIGHRVVHGGSYKEPVFIDSGVKEKIRELSKFAPLHNLEDLEGIEILEKLYPSLPQYAVFDTAFHQTIPEHAKIYGGPYEWYQNGIQKYGFHGINYEYCRVRLQELLEKTPEKVVICHLGSGASLCALYDGKSVDTTMGMTPLDGLVMDTRAGSIDPGILLYLIKRMPQEALSKQLYEESGLLGISGISSDIRDLIKSSEPKAKLALEIYIYQIVKMIGAMAAVLGGIDLLVFTGGIGENSPYIRKQICSRLRFLNLEVKKELGPKQDGPLSKKVFLIHANEEFLIAKKLIDAFHFLEQN